MVLMKIAGVPERLRVASRNTCEYGFFRLCRRCSDEYLPVSNNVDDDFLPVMQIDPARNVAMQGIMRGKEWNNPRAASWSLLFVDPKVVDDPPNHQHSVC